MSTSTSTSAPALRPDRRSGPEFYDRLYVDAHGDAGRIPWSDGRAHPALVRWLDAVAPQLVRCGARVVVPACGFGADAAEVARRGYDVIGFDAAPAALHWARRLDPDGSVSWVEADLFELPGRWRHRFDLVVEVNTVQALGPECRGDVLAAMAELVAPHGHLLAIGRATPPAGVADDGTTGVAGGVAGGAAGELAGGLDAATASPGTSASAVADRPVADDRGGAGADDRGGAGGSAGGGAEGGAGGGADAASPPDAGTGPHAGRPDGPPWPVDPDELVGLAAGVGLEPEHEVHRFESETKPGRWLFRGLFRRPA